MNTKQMIEVMQAYVGGAEIESRARTANSVWFEAGNPGWDWRSREYRIKEQPKTVTLTWFQCESGEVKIFETHPGCLVPFKGKPMRAIKTETIEVSE
jgi:hypothetical protein